MRSALCLVVFCAAIMNAYPSPLRAGEAETVRFGVIMSLSGEFASLGRMHLAGVRMRVAEFNRERRGYRLEVVVYDDKSSPQQAANLTRELLADPDIVAIVGSNATAVCAAMMPIVREAGAVFISPSATSTRIGQRRDGSFRVMYSDAFQGEAMARYLSGALGLRRAAIILNNQYAYCRDIADSFTAAFSKAGGEVVERVGYGFAPDFAALLGQACENKPEAVFLPVYAEDVASFLDTAGRLGIDAVFCGSDSWEQKRVLASAAGTGAPAYYVGVSDDGSDATVVKSFLRMLRVTTEPHAELGSSLGYDALSLLLAGLEKGKSRAELRENMYSLGEVELVTGRIRIGEKGIDKPAYILEIVQDGDGTVGRKVVEKEVP